MIKKEIYQVNGGYYGYIVDNGRFKIQQSHLPAVGGTVGMNKEVAENLADLVVEKLEKNPNDLPTITIEELVSLRVSKEE